MRQLQAQAQILQKPNPITRSESARWLESSLTELGPNAKLSLQGERATLSVDAAPAQALAHWIGLAREHAVALPVQAQLQANASPDTPGLLRGTLVMRLP
jgi:general secretion pathway protein M